ncbi:putative phage abortive infection protein [Lactococcus lactis]|uniref:putative phage abortive infection protein n=1 Tax=Lactococcus lactis TaxID=1358 RepID=UPI0025A0CD1D|nr:putative phage abortive infection protein [Lactococcus lactis]MDM7533518.1 putative phage abortive infection protein [Lactococcus lactis]
MDILFLAQNFTSEFSDSELLSFAGDILSGLIGLLGAGLGVYGAYYVMQKQLKAENEQYRKDRIDNTFFNLLGLFQNVREELDSSNLLYFIRDIKSIKRDRQKNKYYNELFESKKSYFIKDIEKFNKETNDDYDCNLLLDTLKEQGYYNFPRRFGYLINDVENKKNHIDLFKNYAKNLIDFYNDIQKQKTFKYKIDEETIKECVQNGFLNNEYYSGNYFRALYRCLKYIMDSDLKMEDKKFYSGVLRGILSSKEMLVVFYNCMYFEKGKKFKELLEKKENGKRIDFFGDKEDLKNLDKGNDLPFFGKEDLLFSKKDMQKLEELIKGN